jgi:hypothetical protein
VFQAAGCVQHEFADADAVAKQILRAYARGQWEPDYVVVSKFQRADTATILISNSDRARLELSATADLSVGGDLALANAGVGLRATAQSGDVTRFVARKGLTPLYRVLRVKRPLLNRLFGIGAPRVVQGAEPDPSLRQHIQQLGAQDVLEDVGPDVDAPDVGP